MNESIILPVFVRLKVLPIVNGSIVGSWLDAEWINVNPLFIRSFSERDMVIYLDDGRIFRFDDSGLQALKSELYSVSDGSKDSRIVPSFIGLRAGPLTTPGSANHKGVINFNTNFIKFVNDKDLFLVIDDGKKFKIDEESLLAFKTAVYGDILFNDKLGED